ncbi:hypothetical protein BDZ97DRAFT_2083025 [Flammula alnicola]|nr:hypothetical protein BDZ97DRAFT_2083025 [Flammula alnicola]
MLFPCPEPGCDLSFSSARGLNQHRQKCAYAQDDSLPLGGANALARLNEKRARKRQRLNPPDPPGDPEAGPAGPSDIVDQMLPETPPDTIFNPPADPIELAPSPPAR